ncbi:MAG: glycyl-radical enzyme activating protein [Desulfobacter sp.]|nr:MAG: glycyl-radical enzyme activating protein [Desulfobacter sp.]
MANTPLILDIKGNSLDDGPGIRSVVFFKGCPLSCAWCHNPESKIAGPQISFDPERCVGCGTCMKVCGENALASDNPFFVDREKCTLCFDCAGACPARALERVGRPMTVDQVVSQAVRDKVFFEVSGGGVTFSGGEPALFPEFLGRAAEALKERGIHVLVETCGLFDMDQFEARVYPHLDLIYFDIKLMAPEAHRQYCGRSNRLILENFQILYRRYLNGGVPVVPRTPLIPGITDTRENLSAILDFYRSQKVRAARLLPYHPLWREKHTKLGIEPGEGETLPDRWMGREEMAEWEAAFARQGISTRPGGITPE